MKKIEEAQFIARFKDTHDNVDEARFCFILGAGASKESGISTGEELSKQWLKELNESGLFSNDELAEWKKDNEIEESKPETHYGAIYTKRFENDKAVGYERLIKVMETALPSFGYSVLAQLMTKSRHNVVITTNFDNLLETAIYSYTDKRPIVCGHESLAGFASPSNKFPLIVKLHRDLLFEPLNKTSEINNLAEGWHKSLDKILSNHVPIFIGYGGNDGGLMGYLKNHSQLKKLYWCLYKDEVPSDNIKDVVAKHNGLFVRTSGFDSLMYQLQVAIGYKFDPDAFVDFAKDRATKYTEQQIAMDKDQKSKGAKLVTVSAPESGGTKKKSWWDYELMARRAETLEEMDKIYQEGIKNTSSPELLGSYALTLHDTLKNYDQAERLYKEALKLDEENALNNSNYALFLWKIRKDFDQAEEYYRKSLTIDSENAITNGNFAAFLSDIRKDYDQAEKYYKIALEEDPEFANNIGNYANLLNGIRKDYDQAEELYIRALKVNPEHSNNIENYAVFLSMVRKDYDKAEELYKKALDLEPENAAYNANYAIFLNCIRKDYSLAEKYNRKALKLDSENVNSNGNFAQILLSMGRLSEARTYLEKSLASCDTNDLLLELSFYQYAHFRETEGKQALQTIKRLLEAGERSIGWSFDGNIEQAEKEGHPNIPLLKELAKVITTDGSDAKEVIKMIDKEMKGLK